MFFCHLQLSKNQGSKGRGSRLPAEAFHEMLSKVSQAGEAVLLYLKWWSYACYDKIVQAKKVPEQNKWRYHSRYFRPAEIANFFSPAGKKCIVDKTLKDEGRSRYPFLSIWRVKQMIFLIEFFAKAGIFPPWGKFFDTTKTLPK